MATLPLNGKITSHYGEMRVTGMHKGVDISCSIGTKVPSVYGGTVKVALTGYNGGYGYYVKTEGNGVSELFAHLSKIYVLKGQKISAGTIIGLSGNTGRSTGPHLHYELFIDGKRVNPETAIAIGKMSYVIDDSKEEKEDESGKINSFIGKQFNKLMSFGLETFIYILVVTLLIYSLYKTYNL